MSMHQAVGEVAQRQYFKDYLDSLAIVERLHRLLLDVIKDEDLCVHCSLCAERCPTGAWDMQKSTILIPYATDELPDDQPLPAAGSGS